MDVKVTIDGLPKLRAAMAGADKIIGDELMKSGRRSGILVQSRAREHAPVWKGRLRNSIATKTTAAATGGSVTTVGTNLKYARAIELGRPVGAKMPPPGALLAWMASKGIAATEEDVKGTRRVRNEQGEITGSLIGRNTDTSTLGKIGGYLPVEFLIARSIQRNIKKRPYLSKAFKELQPRIRAEFRQVPPRIIARLRGGDG